MPVSNLVKMIILEFISSPEIITISGFIVASSDPTCSEEEIASLEEAAETVDEGLEEIGSSLEELEGKYIEYKKRCTFPKALFTNDVYKPYHHPMLQMMTFVDGTVQGVLQRMIVDETL